MVPVAPNTARSAPPFGEATRLSASRWTYPIRSQPAKRGPTSEFHNSRAGNLDQCAESEHPAPCPQVLRQLTRHPNAAITWVVDTGTGAPSRTIVRTWSLRARRAGGKRRPGRGLIALTPPWSSELGLVVDLLPSDCPFHQTAQLVQAALEFVGRRFALRGG
jgi:hypothetical protein